MTQEDKELLLIDLSARLLYGIVVHTNCGDVKLDRDHRGIGVLYYEHYNEEVKKQCNYDKNHFSIILSGCYYGEDTKPYLRPMSSMTKEEKKEYDSKRKHICNDYNCYCFDTIESIDWLNKNMFDYRGLIEKGFAIAITKDNNPYKE